MSDHARLSPSGSKKWFACPGSLTLEQFVPNQSNDYSDDGTACHQVLEWCLKAHIAGEPDVAAEHSIGAMVPVNGSDEPERLLEFTEAMAQKTQAVIDAVLALADGGVLTAEERVDFSEDIAIPNQFGTLDVCIVRPELFEMGIGDAKFGYRPVYVERNTQLMVYALAKYRQLELSYEIKTVRFWIFQPVIRAEPFEWSCTIEDLLAFANTLRSKGCSVQIAQREFDAIVEAELVPVCPSSVVVEEIVDVSRLFLQPSKRLQEWAQTFLNPKPNDEECAFCRVRVYCPSAANALQAAVDADFEVVAEDDVAGQVVLARVPEFKSLELSTLMKLSGFMEALIKETRAEVERRLLRGETVPDFGLELGRQGNRAWKNITEAEAALKEMRLGIKEMYELKLISPTAAEALATPPKVKKAKKGEAPPPPAPPAVIGPRQWKKLQDLIGRSDPVPSVKPLAVIKTLFQPTQPNADTFAAEPEIEVEEDLS